MSERLTIFPELGKLPPQAVEAEEVLLGAVLLDIGAMGSIADIISPDAFYKEEHKIIFEAALSLYKKHKPIDLVTAVNELRTQGKLEFVGGPFYISELTNRVASSANIEYHARIILGEHLKRRIIEVASKSIKGGYDDTTDAFDLLNDLQSELLSIGNNLMRGAEKHIKSLSASTMVSIEEAQKTDHSIVGVPSGIDALDYITGGYRKGNLYIIAGRPGMGKTSLALSIAHHTAVKQRIPTCIFSLEMEAEQLTKNIFSINTQIENRKIDRGQMEDHHWHQLNVGVGIIERSPLIIDDTPALNVIELMTKAKRLKAQYGIQLFILDYLQLMSSVDRKQGTYDRVSEASRTLKMIAKETQTPFIALSQLSREVEKRGGAKRPILSDLRESGTIEQDADAVFFCYRPEYYGFTTDEAGNSTIGEAEIIIAKNRFGKCETVNCEFVDTTVTFRNKSIYNVSKIPY